MGIFISAPRLATTILRSISLFSKIVNEKYTTPVNLGPAINGKGIVNIEAFVSPDEKFLLIGAFNRPRFYRQL